jgi:hypothetical protein
MFEHTSSTVKWAVIPSDNKRTARLNAITHILASIDYENIPFELTALPPLPAAEVSATGAGAGKGRGKGSNGKPGGDINPEHAMVVPQVYTAKSLNTDECGTSWQAVASALVGRTTTCLSGGVVVRKDCIRSHVTHVLC